jgi:hypothetical protein
LTSPFCCCASAAGVPIDPTASVLAVAKASSFFLSTIPYLLSWLADPDGRPGFRAMTHRYRTTG